MWQTQHYHHEPSGFVAISGLPGTRTGIPVHSAWLSDQSLNFFTSPKRPPQFKSSLQDGLPAPRQSLPALRSCSDFLSFLLSAVHLVLWTDSPGPWHSPLHLAVFCAVKTLSFVPLHHSLHCSLHSNAKHHPGLPPPGSYLSTNWECTAAFSPDQFNLHPLTRSNFVAQADLKLKTFLPQSLRCWDFSRDHHASHIMTLPRYFKLPDLELVIYAPGLFVISKVLFI